MDINTNEEQINEKDFKGKSKETIEKEKQEINPIFLNDPKAVNNSFSDIYSKEEISRLRKKFILKKFQNYNLDFLLY